jgi:hypothetical protein
MTESERQTLITGMHRDEFFTAVERAEREAEEAAAARDTLFTWSDHLRPYLNEHPDLTIAQAIDAYNADHRETASPAM